MDKNMLSQLFAISCSSAKNKKYRGRVKHPAPNNDNQEKSLENPFFFPELDSTWVHWGDDAISTFSN